jgi:uncharacterized secreted protein with C-terminal beta-propeller domain
VIPRGKLMAISKDTAVGKIVYILDENLNICKGNSTGIKFKDAYFAAELESGRIIIPYK